MYIYGDYNLCYSLMKEINPTSSAYLSSISI